jgi:arabinan endo-1,5-alpha-L-arabinosidase
LTTCFSILWILLSSACDQRNDTKLVKEGKILWQSESFGENIEASPAIDNMGNIYTTGGGKLWCFLPDGKVKWSTAPLDEGAKGVDQPYPYPLGVASSPAINHNGNMIYVTGYAGVFAFRVGNGKLMWKKTVFENYYDFIEVVQRDFDESIAYLENYNSKKYPYIFSTTPAISKDGTRLYAGPGENDYPHDSFYCISTDDGSLIWEYVMKHPPQQLEEDKYTRGYLGGASLGLDGTIYVASMHGWLVSLTDNGDSYTENWAYNVGAEMRMPPSIDAEGYIYVGSSSAGGYIHKVNGKTGKSAGGNWPVKTNASEVFANITIGNDGTLYVNSEDYSLWAFNPDGTVKWNNVKFEHWGSDPLIREDGSIIVTSQINGAARIVCIRDSGDNGIIEWVSEAICDSLAFNESNVNIGPDGTIYVHSGVYPPVALYAIAGNGKSLSKESPWPKYMGNIQNNGRRPEKEKTVDIAEEKKAAEINPHIHDPAELQYENGYFMTFSTGVGIRSWYRHESDSSWHLADVLEKPKWWDETFPDNEGYFWAPCVPEKWVMYYSFEADADYASAIGRAVATGTAPNLEWKDDGPVLIMPDCRDNGTNCPVAIDPSVYKDDKGEMYMAFGSGTSGIWIVELDKNTGHLSAEAAKGFSWENKAFHRVAHRRMLQPREPTDYIEAAYVYTHPENGYYYLFVNWGQCCSGVESTYQIMVGRSKSPTGPFLDKSGKDMVDEGGTLILQTEGRYIGPGHANIYRHSDGRYAFSFHYYDGENDGRARLAVRELKWIDDWPVITRKEFF